jgi:hypothetical protein
MTASAIVASIESHAVLIASAIRVYPSPHLSEAERDDLVITLGVVIERLKEDWRVFAANHDREKKERHERV